MVRCMRKDIYNIDESLQSGCWCKPQSSQEPHQTTKERDHYGYEHCKRFNHGTHAKEDHRNDII